MTRTIAAFDFDGTITKRDTLIPFLAKAAGPARFTSVCAQLGLLGVRRRIPITDRDAVKERMIELLLAGRAEHDLRTLGERYARDLLTSDRLRPDMLARIAEHHRAGHTTILVSASLVYYLEPIARELHMDDVIGVEPEVLDGVLTGHLTHPNVRAEQKAIRLRAWLGASADGPLDGIDVHAYGNSSGDHELLAMSSPAWWLGSAKKMPAGAAGFRPGTLRG